MQRVRKNSKSIIDVCEHVFGEKKAKELLSKTASKAALDSKTIKYNNKEYSFSWTNTTEKEKEAIVKMSAPDVKSENKNKYGIDALTVVTILYGKNSKIYKAMESGEKISDMIKVAIEEKNKNGKPRDEVEECLLKKCLKREKELGL